MARLRPIGDLQDLPKVHTFCAHHTGRRLASRFSGRKRSDSRSLVDLADDHSVSIDGR
jgi:hypothetical protein